MNKINGYTEEEAKSLVEYIWAGKQAGRRSRHEKHLSSAVLYQ